MRRPGLRGNCGTASYLLSSIGMPIDEISHLVGHANTRITELVYRKELRPMLTRGASAMDALFGEAAGRRPPKGKQLGKQQP